MDDDCQTLLDVISDADGLGGFLNVDDLDVSMPSHPQQTSQVPASKNRLSHDFVASYIDGAISETEDPVLNSITDAQNVMLTNDNASGLITAAFDPGGQQTDTDQGQESAEAMDDPSLMLNSQVQNSVSMDAHLKDIFGDDDLFSDTSMETSANPFDSLLSQAAAEAGVFPFMDDLDETMDSTHTQQVQPQTMVTNQLVIPAGQPVANMPQPVGTMPQPVGTMQQQPGTMPQKVNTMPVFNQTLQPMIANQPGQATTAVLQVTPSGQQIIQQIPANAQPGQQILIQGLMPQLGQMKTSQGNIGTVQLLQGLQGQQQPLTSYFINTAGTRIPIQTVVNSAMQQKLQKITGKSGPVAISPKPSSKGPRYISPKPQPGQRVIQILPNQAVTRTLQIAPRAPGQPQTFLIRNPNMPGNQLQLVQGISTGGMVRAPNYQVIQGNNPGMLTTQPSSTSTQSNTSSSKRKQKNAQSNTQTTQSKSIASSTAFTNQLQGNFANTLNYNFPQSVNSQRTIVTVTETENKTSHPVITIGASGSTIVVKQSKPINVTAKHPGLGNQTAVTSVSNLKSMMNTQPTVLSNQLESHLVLPTSSTGSQMTPLQPSLDALDSQIQLPLDGSASYQNMQPHQQLPGQNPTKQQNIPAFANQILSQSVPQAVQSNSTFVNNTASNPAQNPYPAPVQQSIGQQHSGVLNQILSQQMPPSNISLTHRQLQIQPDNNSSSSYSVGLPPQQSTQLLQGSVVQNQPDISQSGALLSQSDKQQQKTRDLQIAIQRNPNILKDLMLKHPAVFQNSFKNNPQMQQKLQTLFQQIKQNPGAGNILADNATQPQQIGPAGSMSLHDQSNTQFESQSGFQANSQLIGPPNTNVQDLLLNQPLNTNQNSNLGSSIQPITSQQQPVISARAAAIMKYPPNRSKTKNKNSKAASRPSVSTSSNINLSTSIVNPSTSIVNPSTSNINPSSIQTVQDEPAAATPAVAAPVTNQGLNLPQTFQISIKAQEQLQTIQNHIRTLTGMQNLTDQQTRLLQQLHLIQQKIVIQARQQMMAQQTKPPVVSNTQSQPAANKSNKKTAKNATATQINATGKEPLTVKQEPTNSAGLKTSNLTPSQQQIVRSFQEKLKSMTPEEQQAYIKSQQQSLLLALQQKQANQGQTSSGSQLIRIESKGTKRSAQYQLTRSSLMQHQINQNQEKSTAPDLQTPFKNYKDAVQRLLNYHVSTDHTPTSEQLQDIDEAFEEVSVGILEKKQKMYGKYQELIMQDSMKTSEASEMVMLGRLMLQDEKTHFEEEKELPQDQLLTKLRTLPGLKLLEDKFDLESEPIQTDAMSDLISPIKMMQDDIGHDASPIKLEIKSECVQEVMNPDAGALEVATPAVASPPLDHRTTDESAEILELGSKDYNGFITRELPVDGDGRQKTLKLKIKLRRPSTLQDLLEEQDIGGGDRSSDVDESRPPTCDSSLDGEPHQLSNSYDAFEISDIDEDINIMNGSNGKTSFVGPQDENTQDESIASELNDDDDDDREFQDEDGFESTGALNVQNQSAIHNILNFRDDDEIPSPHGDHTDMYESRDDGMVNGLDFEFDDGDDETMQDFSETENTIRKLDRELDEFSSMQDPDLEEAVNSILF